METEKTLRDLWIEKGYSSTRLAVAAGCTVPVVYKANRKERIRRATLLKICRLLDITEEEYHRLPRCSRADEFPNG